MEILCTYGVGSSPLGHEQARNRWSPFAQTLGNVTTSPPWLGTRTTVDDEMTSIETDPKVSPFIERERIQTQWPLTASASTISVSSSCCAFASATVLWF